MRAWEEFVNMLSIFTLRADLVRFLEVHDLSEPSEADVPLFKKLVHYYSCSRDGNLDELVTVNTVLNFWQSFVSVYRLKKMQVPKEMITEVTNVREMGENNMIIADQLFSIL